MGMGYAANWADVMEWDDIKKIVPEEAAAFEQHLQAAGISMDEFCRAIKDDDWDFETDDEEAAIDRILEAWDCLDKSFTNATTVGGTGLEIEPDYHDPEFGGRYDGVENGFFRVEGVYQLTPAGEKVADKIDRRGYVEFG